MSDLEPLLKDPTVAPRQYHPRDEQSTEQHSEVEQFIRETHVTLASDDGLKCVVVFYVCMVILNCGALLSGLMNPKLLDEWWFVLLEVLLTVILIMEVSYKYLYSLYLDVEDNFFCGHSGLENTFDVLVAGFSVFATILIIAQGSAGTRTDDDVDDDSVFIRILRDGARILRTLLFIRTMVRLQVTFCHCCGGEGGCVHVNGDGRSSLDTVYTDDSNEVSPDFVDDEVYTATGKGLLQKGTLAEHPQDIIKSPAGSESPGPWSKPSPTKTAATNQDDSPLISSTSKSAQFDDETVPPLNLGSSMSSPQAATPGRESEPVHL